MDVRIGVQHAARELELETDMPAADVEQLVRDAAHGTTDVLRLVDTRGNLTLVPAGQLAYVQIGVESSRKVGFVG